MPYEGAPGSLITDEVRLLIGDTSATDPYLSDDEIDYLISTHTTAIVAAYNGALILAAKFAGLRDISVGSARLEYGSMATRYKELSESLAKRGGDAGLSSAAKVGPPVAGGIAGDIRDDGTTVVMWSDVDWENASTEPDTESEES